MDMSIKTTALLIIVIGYIAKFIVEASHDFIISNFEQDHEDQIAWHRVDWWDLFIQSVIVASLFDLATYDGTVKMGEPGTVLILGFSFQPFMIMTIISMLKILVFNVRINHLFGNEWFYLSKDGFEGKFKGTIGIRGFEIRKEKIYYLIALSVLIIAIVSIFY